MKTRTTRFAAVMVVIAALVLTFVFNSQAYFVNAEEVETTVEAITEQAIAAETETAEIVTEKATEETKEAETEAPVVKAP